ncbi:MAG: bifunctional (p)ppGpp synthetase/guanosine-3',5'-bis(diphosphate) 3'-pyrophosphohydrolase [Clostridia bacterium]
MDKWIEQFKEKLQNQKASQTYNIELIEQAYYKAVAAHDGQKRKSGDPYIIHPLEVAEIILEMGLDTESIIAGILHDCIEDTEFNYDQIKDEFGETIADLVNGVTRLGMIRYSKEQEQMEDLRKMFMAMAKDIRVILIKLADRLHNMRTMEFLPDHKRRSKSLETMEIYAPIAHRLGMQRVKWELEDLSLIYLDPIGYKEITEGLHEQETSRFEFLNRIQNTIMMRLEESGISGEIGGRVKHIYSIYRKMYSQHKTVEEIYDICAVRVKVATVADCYNVLGHIHDLYKPIPGRFKDYISTPKPNGYRSLHTTVIGRAGVPFEVQIRTHEMHFMAEYGVAAHWKYKADIQTSSGEETFNWIRQLLEAGQDTQVEDFIKNIKVDLFADEVFVFTPKGDVINMPASATPIDFAYAIHSAVGNRMTGCKLNGKIAPIDTGLKNGDIIEVITSKETHGPSRDWLKIVKTSEARNKIKQWFKKEKREENIIQGKEDLERELRIALIHKGFFDDTEVQKIVLEKLLFKDLDELYSAIGYGGITLTRVINRIKEEVAKKRKRDAEINAKNGVVVPIKKSQKSNNGVIVDGIDSCLVKFSRCCSPLPGDDIVGFVTRGYGVSIHRRDCVNYVNGCITDEDKKRWVQVSWDESYFAGGGTKGQKFSTSLQISGRSRNGFLSDIIAVLSSSRISITEFGARDLPDGYAVMNAVIEIHDIEHLNFICNKIRQVSGVMDVIRQAN